MPWITIDEQYRPLKAAFVGKLVTQKLAYKGFHDPEDDDYFSALVSGYDFGQPEVTPEITAQAKWCDFRDFPSGTYGALIFDETKFVGIYSLQARYWRMPIDLGNPWVSTEKVGFLQKRKDKRRYADLMAIVAGDLFQIVSNAVGQQRPSGKL